MNHQTEEVKMRMSPEVHNRRLKWTFDTNTEKQLIIQRVLLFLKIGVRASRTVITKMYNRVENFSYL